MPLGINSISGLVSGMDTSALVDSLIEFERRPAYILEASKARAELKLASFDAIEAVLSNLRGVVETLRRPSDFRTMGATVTHDNLVSATVDRGAPAGVYSVRVNQLAQSHQVTSQGFSDEETVLGSGTVTLSLGGVEDITVELVEGDNSLRALSEAINQAGGSITASLINTGDASNPHQLILTGSETGEEQTISVSTDLTGGTGIDFGDVASVTIGSQSGSASIASGGHYTGNVDAGFSFSVATGGVVGSDTIVIDWSNDQGDSGQLVLDSSYAGEEVEIMGSMTLSFGAGDLQAGDDWTVSGTSSTIQAAQDAKLSFGGSSPIEISSASNTVDNLISGVSLNLIKADAGELITIKVEQDVDSLVGKLQSFVDEYNGTIDFFMQQFSYNPETETSGILLGDRTAMRLDSDIRNDVIRSVSGLSSEFSQLVQIGIGSSVGDTLDVDGKLNIDTDILREAISEDLDGVINLLGSTGVSSDDDIVFLNAGSEVQATGGLSGYEVFVTQAATQGRYNAGSISTPSGGSPLSITANNKYLKLSVDGVTSSTLSLDEGNYTSGEALATAIQNKVNADEELGGKGVLVSWVDDGGGNGHVEIVSKQYGGNSSVTIEEVDNDIYSAIGLDSGSPINGKDVAGYFMVNGEEQEATGSGRILTGSGEDAETKGLSLQVNLTTSTLSAQGEAQGTVQIWSGVTNRLHQTLAGVLDSVNGIISTHQDSIRDTVDDYDDQVKKIDARLAKRKERYLKEFLRMETTLSELNSTSSTFQSMMANLPGIAANSNSS
jgi:flagellar hook-associated protein 2